MVNILHDSVVYSYNTGLGTEWTPQIHVEIECSWIEWAREITGRDSLFVYRHLGTGAYVLADWIIHPEENRGPGLMTELECVGKHPDQGGFSEFGGAALRARCVPVAGLNRTMARRVQALKKARQAERDMQELERIAVAKWLRKKMGNHSVTPELIASGALPWHKPAKDDQYRFKDTVKMLRGRA